MSESKQENRIALLEMQVSEFWSGDIGLTLVSIALVVLIFVILPLRQAGTTGRVFLDLVIVTLMISGTLVVKQSRIVTAGVVALVIFAASMLWVSRFYPTLFLRQLSSALSVLVMLVYVRIVLLVMFRRGHVTWSRIQGGVCAYLLLGLAWASAYHLVEQVHPGAFHFVSSPATIDELTDKLIYFSFATLTTVGYGDVVAVSPYARSLAIGEAIVGQLFPAILIGALVAMAMRAGANSKPAAAPVSVD
ncbi:MAG TPA: potassium channel family protein [Candidatus Sulfotelmatobacter sp.]|nr:potassium channel family protein [Candidatus Sulfotelmatobacter sp.]